MKKSSNKVLKEFIKETLDKYFKPITDSDSFEKESVFVPFSVKKKIKKWLEKMKMKS